MELLTTVDMAVQDLKESGKEVSAKSVHSRINDHQEWRPKLKWKAFSLNNIERAINELERFFNKTY